MQWKYINGNISNLQHSEDLNAILIGVSISGK